MDKKEKIRKLYQKSGVFVNEETMKNILQDKKITNELMKQYKQEEINSMNYILGKPDSNNYFTKFELKALSKVDLFNRKVIEWCKLIWDNKDNEENLDEIVNALNERRCPKCI